MYVLLARDPFSWLRAHIQSRHASEYMKVHIFELQRMKWRYVWSSQLYTQLKQLRNWSLKKIQAWTGFEPMTSAIPVQCSTNWAIEPTGSWSFCGIAEVMGSNPVQAWIPFRPAKDKRWKSSNEFLHGITVTASNALPKLWLLLV